MSKAINFTTYYDHPIEKVWSALTTKEALNEWLMPNNFEPILGYKFQFKTKPRFGFDGITHCKVLVLEEPHQLSFSWSGGDLKDTIVTFQLIRENASRTRLDFEHKGFEGFMNKVLVRRILARGWKKTILAKQLPKYLSQ